MTDQTHIVLDDDAIYRLSNPIALIDHLRGFLARSGTAPQRLHLPIPGASGGALLVMPAHQDGLMGVKALTFMPDNPAKGRPAIAGRFILFDAATGEVRAILSAAALTNLRTAAVSALAADILAPASPATLLMIGTGALAEHMVRAHLAVRSYSTVILWGRDRHKTENLRGRLTDHPAHIAVADPQGLADAIGAADVICAATSSLSPLIEKGALRSNVHADLVGSFTPTMREADAGIFAGADLVVDTIEAFEKSGDLLAPLAAGLISGKEMTLTQLLRQDRNADERANVTIFKAVGQALSDLGAADYLVRAAQLAPSP